MGKKRRSVTVIIPIKAKDNKEGKVYQMSEAQALGMITKIKEEFKNKNMIIAIRKNSKFVLCKESFKNKNELHFAIQQYTRAGQKAFFVEEDGQECRTDRESSTEEMKKK